MQNSGRKSLLRSLQPLAAEHLGQKDQDRHHVGKQVVPEHLYVAAQRLDLGDVEEDRRHQTALKTPAVWKKKSLG